MDGECEQGRGCGGVQGGVVGGGVGVGVSKSKL
jgi:hypothetical protein